MGKFYKAAMIYKEKKMLVGLKQVMDVMEGARAEGKPDNDAETKKKIEAMLTQMQDKVSKDIEMLAKRQGDDDIPVWNFSEERKLPVFAEDEVVLLRALQEVHRDLYIQVKKENSYTIAGKSAEEQQKYWEAAWNDTKVEKFFAVEIVSKETNVFVGYAAINNTKQPVWEISIELLAEQVNKGFGTRALSLFVNKIYEITGIHEYKALVESDNIMSQRMMSHVNAELVGIVEYFFSNEEDTLEFEEENLSKIDANMTRIAAELGVEPRKLISHVLDYRIIPANFKEQRGAKNGFGK